MYDNRRPTILALADAYVGASDPAHLRGSGDELLELLDEYGLGESLDTIAGALVACSLPHANAEIASRLPDASEAIASLRHRCAGMTEAVAALASLRAGLAGGS